MVGCNPSPIFSRSGRIINRGRRNGNAPCNSEPHHSTACRSAPSCQVKYTAMFFMKRGSPFLRKWGASIGRRRRFPNGSLTFFYIAYFSGVAPFSGVIPESTQWLSAFMSRFYVMGTTTTFFVSLFPPFQSVFIGHPLLFVLKFMF